MTEWYSLFDTGTRDHVVEMVKTGDPAAPMALLNQLVPMIESYQAENIKPHGLHIGIRAARELKSTAQTVARMIDPQEIERQWVERFGDQQNADRKQELADTAYRVNARKLKEAWTGFIAAGAGHLQYHEKPKQRAARVKGSKARGEKKADWKDDAIRLFDPGPEAGSKQHRSRIIRKRAIEAGFKNAEKLPQRLDKDLS